MRTERLVGSTCLDVMDGSALAKGYSSYLGEVRFCVRPSTARREQKGQNGKEARHGHNIEQAAEALNGWERNGRNGPKAVISCTAERLFLNHNR